MSPKDYIEAVALELGKLRGRGLVLSPADAQLALAWHAADVPLQLVLGEIRKGTRLKSRAGGVRGTAEVGVSLQAIAPSIDSQVRARPRTRAVTDAGLCAELLASCAPSLPSREAWQALARNADTLLSRGGEAYWTVAVGTLKATLRTLPRKELRKVGRALRARMAPRPRSMPKDRYKRSLQLMLLSVASHELGVPPKPFLL